jgi:hypothetical protein
MNSHADFLDQLRRIIGAVESERVILERALRFLAKWRSQLIQNTVIAECGTIVQSGPFKGMRFAQRSAEGCHVPKLLGTYEHELHPYIETAVMRSYRHVVNIGMAEGYYAVGLAMRMPNARVHGFDSNEKARATARAIAEMNNVSDRVEIGGVFAGEDFADYPAGDTLVICDIEGAEDALLDPARFSVLAGMDLIAELHECFKPGIAYRIGARFEASHDIMIVPNEGPVARPPDFFQRVDHLDQLLALWEWRTGPTPWGVMTRKH